MKHVHKSVLLWHSPRQMYRLVTDVEAYSAFLPWCERSEVLQRHDDGVTARLHIAFAGVKQAFTTRNQNVEAESVTMTLVDGPFSHLQGHWRFLPLGGGQALDATNEGGGAGQGPDAPACKVEFSLAYAFSNRPLAMLISPVFDRIAHTFVEAFVKRAQDVYGDA